MTEFSFDPYEGKLLVGQPAIEQHREAGGEPIALAELLEAEEFPFDPDDYEPHMSQWSREDAIAWGKWVLSVIQAENDEVFNSAGGSHLNLITCAGAWDQSKRRYSDRLVVFADKIEQ